jgi:hypothetical protein
MPRSYNWIRGEGTTKNQRGLGFMSVSDIGNNVNYDPDWWEPDVSKPAWGVEGPIGTTTPINSTITDNLVALGLKSSSGISWLPILLIGGIAILAFRR